MVAKISANLRTDKQYNPLGMVVCNTRHTNDFIKKKILDVIQRRCGLGDRHSAAAHDHRIIDGRGQSFSQGLLQFGQSKLLFWSLM